MSWQSLLGYFIYLAVGTILIVIISQFTSVDNAGAIVSGIIVISVFIYGFFSFRKNVRLLNTIPSENDIPQDLIINGIRLDLTVRTIAWLKLITWIGFYLILIFIASEILQAPERAKQKKIQTEKVEKEHDITFAPFYQLIKNSASFTPVSKYIPTYRREKILPLNGETNKIDDIYFELPKHLQPQDTSEVNMIIKLYRKREKVGTYSNHSTAYHRSIRVKFYDLTTHEIIGEDTFYGKLPPNEKSGSGDEEGGDPNISLLEFLEKLPIKNK